MDKYFSFDYDIAYRAVDKNLNLTLPCLMEYLQETSIKHSNSTGYTIDWFKNKMEAFVLTNWHVEIYKYPKFADKIKIVTYPGIFKSFLAERAFLVFDQAGEKLAMANSRWLYLDLINHTPIKPSPKIHEAFMPFGELPLKKSYAFKLDNSYNFINSQKLFTKKSDIDSNFHVNNIKYLYWAFDLLDDDSFYNKKISVMKTEYKKECLENVELTSELYSNGNNFISCIKDEHDIYCNTYFSLE